MFCSAQRLFVAGIVANSTLFALAGTAQSATILLQDTNVAIYGSGANDVPSLTEQKIYLVASGASGTTSPPGGDGTLDSNASACSAGSACANFASSSVVNLANGFANITPFANKTVYHDLTFTVPGYKFGDFFFDTQLNDSKTNGPNLSITVNGTDVFNILATDLKANADLSFAVVAKGSFFITSILLTSINANDSAIGFNETKHFQVSDLQLQLVCTTDCTGNSPPPDPTPIPGAVWLFGTVIAGGVGFGRWRRKRKNAASATA